MYIKVRNIDKIINHFRIIEIFKMNTKIYYRKYFLSSKNQTEYIFLYKNISEIYLAELLTNTILIQKIEVKIVFEEINQVRSTYNIDKECSTLVLYSMKDIEIEILEKYFKKKIIFFSKQNTTQNIFYIFIEFEDNIDFPKILNQGYIYIDTLRIKIYYFLDYLDHIIDINDRK
ncbi:hypothetical protein CWI38_2398p0020 [Hamiltosporidium tvaerminnensis]|uniref:Uncharacterized protein n=1 Tax=Hamiltosporidium tvaerminnensis TaxID=1176355 RepID=A0A4Q9LI34_9MICR|nr:hypothetical protein CWI37_2141p0020 [Hamiltosporidium tvaerminnensis]TBU07446.1 hypothetical protein CWI38_2398p0020 [Hamiltosporidium tvaerminnensis]